MPESFESTSASSTDLSGEWNMHDDYLFRVHASPITALFTPSDLHAAQSYHKSVHDLTSRDTNGPVIPKYTKHNMTSQVPHLAWSYVHNVQLKHGPSYIRLRRKDVTTEYNRRATAHLCRQERPYILDPDQAQRNPLNGGEI